MRSIETEKKKKHTCMQNSHILSFDIENGVGALIDSMQAAKAS